MAEKFEYVDDFWPMLWLASDTDEDGTDNEDTDNEYVDEETDEDSLD